MMQDATSEPTSSSDHTRLPRLVFGSAAVYLGALILIIAGCDEFGGGLNWLPRFWYVNRPVLIGLGMLMVPVGIAVQAGRAPLEKRWKPALAGRRFREIRIYSRNGCHLCDDAVELLWSPLYRPYLPVPDVIDIDEDPELKAQFDTSVPVLEFDGTIRFTGRVDEVLLRRLIEGTSPL